MPGPVLMADAPLGDSAVIVLAAGRSQRMGPRNKLLMEIEGKPLLAHALQTVRSLAPAEFLVVTGYDHDPIAHLAASYGARVVHNQSHCDGMGTSIACGAAALIGRRSDIFIHLGDVPFVAATTYVALARARSADQDATCQAFAPRCAGRRGHPILFRNAMRAQLGQLRGDEGARHLLAEAACLEVDVDDPMIACDIDSESDLAALKRSR